MITEKFKQHIAANPRLAAAFAEFKLNMKEWYKKWPDGFVSETECYRINV
ncbi:MAG: hypothetical protein FWC78_03060 [Defluviitaleaceae bacterium]|nr:hypothetical protein [Defluviitaleaceae bacterium]